MTLTLSINAINNHKDNIDFHYFVETRSFLPPMSEIQCWQTSYCKTPLLGDILCSGENHQVAYRPFMNEKLCLLATVEIWEAISG
jgi:hypothetical protein